MSRRMIAALISSVVFLTAQSPTEAQPNGQGFQSLFNGTDLTGWDGNPKLWSVKEGAITGQTTAKNPAKRNTFLIWTNGTVADFELRCSFRLVPGDTHGFANSGIQYRSKVVDPANWVVGGYQADMEAGPDYTGILYEERFRGIMAQRGEKVVWDKDCKKQVVGSVGTAADIEGSLRKGDWNDYVIIAQGNHLRQFVNGKQTIDVTDECESKRAMSGVLALQLRAGSPMMAQFKDIRVKTLFAPDQPQAAAKKVVFIAGPPSHGPREHEHRAGCLLLKSCLDNCPGVTSVVYSNDWPQNPTEAFTDAATVVVYSDGGGGHPLLQADRLNTIGELTKKGVGLVCIHYAVEPTKEKGEKEFLDWIGGCFEINRSVNPTWTADFKELPKHPITSGVNPFKIFDEWYFFMRFRDGMAGVTPILTDVAPESTMSRADGSHEGNPAVRASVKRGEPQAVAWACERPDGGRGFGFTGGHYHKNWGNDDFRKLVLNAILWTAKANVPAEGVSSTITEDDLKKNLDNK